MTHKNRWKKTHNNNKNQMRVSMTVEFAYVLYTTNRLSRSIDYCELNVLLLFAAMSSHCLSQKPNTVLRKQVTFRCASSAPG